jgi:hypothetical protein
MMSDSEPLVTGYHGTLMANGVGGGERERL